MEKNCTLLNDICRPTHFRQVTATKIMLAHQLRSQGLFSLLIPTFIFKAQLALDSLEKEADKL